MGKHATKIPQTVTAGTTLRIECPDNAILYLRGPISCEMRSKDGYLLATPAETGSWQSGCYLYALRQTGENGDVVELASGSLQVNPDIMALPAGDMRSHAQKTYDAICAVIERRASLDQQEYKINNRELKRTPISDLLKLKTHYALLVRQERGKSAFREHKVIF